MRHNHDRVKLLSIFTLSFWLVLFALLPLLLVLLLSLLQFSESQIFIWHFTLDNYREFFSAIFLNIFTRSLLLALGCTILCLIVAYPAAFFLAGAQQHYRPILLMLMVIPFWTSSLIRTYAILTLIKAKGLINVVLLSLGIIHQPLQLLYTNTAVVIGVVYNLLPFMILPLYSNIEKLDHHIFEAARDLGANRLKMLISITIPLTFPGIVAGTILVFLPAMTLFYIPDILGGAKSLLLGNLVENQFLSMNNWPAGCATSMVLTLLMLLLVYCYRRAKADAEVGLI